MPFSHDLPPDSAGPHFEPSAIGSRPNKALPTEETPMPEFVRAVAAWMRGAPTGGRLAGATRARPRWAPARAGPRPAQPPAVKQMALTDKQIEGVLAAQRDMDAITEKLPDNAKPDPRITAQLE